MGATNESRSLELLRLSHVRRPLAAALVGRIADSIASLAIVVLVSSERGSYSLAGVAAGAFAIGTAVGAPLAGRLLDRFPDRTTLPAFAAAFAFFLAALVPAAPSLGNAWLVFLAGLAGATRPPLEAALRAGWARALADEQLGSVYVLDSTLQELVWIAGPLLFALLLATGGNALPLFACGALSVLGTLAYVRSVEPASLLNARNRRRGVGPLHSRALRALLATACLYGVAIGILTVGLAAFASAQGSRPALGWLIALWAVGSLIGGLAYGARHWRSQLESRALWALGLFGLALMLLAAAPSLVALAPLMLLLGLPLSPWLGSLSAAVQRATPSPSVTEGFAWAFSGITAGMALGNAVGGQVIEAGGTRPAFLCAGFAAFAGVAVGLGLVRGPASARRFSSGATAPNARIS